ncbi:DNA mismatch repair protein MutS [Aciduliprofundum sp. MAR08-339]|uniref:DNA mismatch repair protein MutS n=1 Tax=Aciduliprofundum sp. (strain MAR08-339) TaxID=673860 RepID=UPI0002A4B9E7|nr:DNA mismatch repair protein MutS [Aciduliprofundum sp. MAR08-339]
MATPLMRQYHKIKAKYRDAILFFRVGDFYETFEEDAKIVSKELNIVLTRRSKEEPVPMAGIPHHALDAYLSRLVKKGYRVAICEQLEDPKKAKGLVKRDVIRIVTPGTLIEDTLLTYDNNFLLSVYRKEETYGFAALDISTGEFFAGELDFYGINGEILRLSPAEIISNVELKVDVPQKIMPEEYYSDYESLLKDHFKVAEIEGFGIGKYGLKAAAAALKYAKENTMSELKNITSLQGYFRDRFLILDSTTLKNLEVFKNFLGEERYTLFFTINACVTPMGSRLLKRWMQRPLKNVDEIEKRQDAVEELTKKQMMLESIRDVLSHIKDLERIKTRISLGRARPKDLIALKEGLKYAQDLKMNFESKILREESEKIEGLGKIVDLIERSIAGDYPIGDGVIKRGYSRELDSLRDLTLHAQDLIGKMEERERRRTGIKSLKIGYNDVMGYYIEVSKANLSKVPDHYKRKQTLKNSERFITDELKDLEYRILSAKEKINDIEQALYEEIIEKLKGETSRIARVAEAIAHIDTIQSLAKVALEWNYTRPIVDESMDIAIKNGRHPVVERYTDFVPNDTNISGEARFIMLTGPNMAGKSTYMRQVALITILAQMGSFVPADYAKIGVVDRIYTRVGASDDITRGRSTFMMEMVELANILNTATERSLILLDEIGRGTSTYDGLAIAWSITEHIHNKIKARTIFATHYHHLIELENVLENVRNYHIAVKETPDGLVFVRKVMPGGMSKSYGIEVAKLAGVPEDVVKRAKNVLEMIEEEKVIEVRRGRRIVQTMLFGNSNCDEILEELKNLDIMNMTPLEALNKLNELKNRASKLK